jgi:predicted RNA-binding Zn-ribbon protein involved in translation (DUF1610 family)
LQNLYEKIAYLKGLAEGLNVNEATKEGKLIMAMIDVLSDVVEAVSLIDQKQQKDYDFLDSNDFNFTYICPSCNEDIQIDETSFADNENIICPKCNETIVILTHDV